MTEVIKHTSKLWERKRDVSKSDFLVWCDGCGRGHSFEWPRWVFNGNYEKPTFTPSLRIYIPAGTNRPELTLCHFNIVDGEMKYCSDFEHSLKGQTVPMSDIPPDYGF